MIQLAILLIGAEAFRNRWYALSAGGLLWMILGGALMLDVSDGASLYTADALGGLLVVLGVGGLLSALLNRSRRSRALVWRTLVFMIAGLLVLDVPFDHGLSDSILFGSAFLIGGVLRLAAAYVVRFERWWQAMVEGVIELLLAIVIFADWPVHHSLTVPFSFGVLLLISGLTLVQLGLDLWRLPPGAPITNLRLFFSRNWHRGAVVLDRTEEPAAVPTMTLYVWTPLGVIRDPQRRLLVDRYIAAVDGKGVISTGHSALEMLPEIYISHYPAVDLDHSSHDFTQMLRAGSQNDVPGRWNATHSEEVSGWCEPDQKVIFRRYSPAALRAFWEEYRQDSTYNLTSRSCSTATSLALETALEGSLSSGWPWAKLVTLLVDPRLWTAALLRRRAVTMAWTPGLVLDYARALRELVEGGKEEKLPEQARPEIPAR